MNLRARQTVWSVILLTVGGAAAALIVSSREDPVRVVEEPPAPWVRTEVVVPRAVRLDVTSHGTVAPHTESRLVAQVSGRIEWVSPQFVAGGFVEQGDLLVRLDVRDYDVAVIRAEAALARARTRLALEQSEATVARAEWDALGEGAGDPLVLREPQMSQASAELEAARADLTQARINRERTQVTAPYRGRVVERQVDLGQFVSANAELGRVYAIEGLEVRLPMADHDLAYLPRNPETGDLTGTVVSLESRFGGSAWSWPAKVVRTEGRIDPKTRMLVLVAQVDAAHESGHQNGAGRRAPDLLPGLFVEATLHGLELADVVVLPRAAMRGPDTLFVVDADSRLVTRQVEVQRTERDRVVLSGGLVAGERVCLSLLETATDGTPVRFEAEDGQP